MYTEKFICYSAHGIAAQVPREYMNHCLIAYRVHCKNRMRAYAYILDCNMLLNSSPKDSQLSWCASISFPAPVDAHLDRDETVDLDQ